MKNCLVLFLIAFFTLGWRQSIENQNPPWNQEETEYQYSNSSRIGTDIISGPYGPSGEDYDQAFRSLTVHPKKHNIILLGTERNGFIKSTDGGKTWRRYRKGLKHFDKRYPEIWDIAFFSGNPKIVLAATLDSAGPAKGEYPSFVAGIYKSTDGGKTWSHINNGLKNTRANSVRFDSTDSKIAVVGIEGNVATFSQLKGKFFKGGIYRTTDGGANWHRLKAAPNDIRNGYWRIEARGGNPTSFYTFAMNYNDLSKNVGFLKSTNSGVSWKKFGKKMQKLMITGFDLSQTGTVLYANERDSYAIQKSVDGGKTWTNVPFINANGVIAVSPEDPQQILYSGSATLYRSMDGLQNVEKIFTALDTIEDIVYAPSKPRIVYLVAKGYLFYRSTNRGKTFKFIKNIRTDVLNVIPYSRSELLIN